MENLVIHNVPPELTRALERESARLRASLDQTVIELLRHALKIGSPKATTNGLASLAGTWTAEEHERFEAAIG